MFPLPSTSKRFDRQIWFGPSEPLNLAIFKFALSPYDDWKTLAWAGALLITLAVLIINILARSVFKQAAIR